MIHYVFLGVAIVLECIASSMLKTTVGFTKPVPSVVCLTLYAVCFFMLSKALEGMPLSVAYATWCAVGIIITTAVSVLVYKDHLNLMTGVGIALTVAGVVLINLFGGGH
ncbi:DMT family transporter [Bifidobacterium oedipodis]|uniref:Quaternary ammonium transporter n=1 Tax=Bifidobacterium oedipodis TaxID=2675322 RepID=A0A7Y0ESM8_9BIFI|nr:multidrug efflux SMR transporter [Bifidobacterium sp. DSM 109957]NMM94601.1 quaternary ammonium transporter [Bifidobacterium sp. DSM 109957]